MGAYNNGPVVFSQEELELMYKIIASAPLTGNVQTLARILGTVTDILEKIKLLEENTHAELE